MPKGKIEQKIAERLKNEVTRMQSAQDAIISLHDITEEIIKYPKKLRSENPDEFRTCIMDACQRVSNINKACRKRIILSQGFKGEPEDWVSAVLTLRALSGTSPDLQIVS